MKSLEKAAALVLTRDYLIAANTGRPFTTWGLDAVAYGSLTSKTEARKGLDDPNVRFASEESAQRAIQEIVASQRRTYSDPKRLASAINALTETSQNYAGRVLFELLQNAADANSNEPIGYKGIGFRSILNVTAAPRIHSGNLHVRWSKEDAQLEIDGNRRDLPMLEVPCWCGSEEMEPAARALINDGYATVIILRLTESTWSVLKKEWDEVSNDLSLLVLIEGLETLVWEVDSQKTTWRRSQDADVVRLQSFRDGQLQDEQRWRLHKAGKAGEVVVAVPVDEIGRVK